MDAKPMVWELASRLQQLLETGRIEVPHPLTASELDDDRAWPILQEFEQEYRQTIAHRPPPLDRGTSLWAAGQFLRACQFAVYRELGPELINTGLEKRPPGAADTAAVHYSVDLTFRFLPDLYRFVKAAATLDPLLDRMEEWAGDWPLSSVGIAGIQPGRDALVVILAEPCLMMMYMDRIELRGDDSRWLPDFDPYSPARAPRRTE
jgi:hypothetical protein